jgi:hypothetical protein
MGSNGFCVVMCGERGDGREKSKQGWGRGCVLFLSWIFLSMATSRVGVFKLVKTTEILR